MAPQKIDFLNGSSQGATFFDISRYLTDKYFDIVWGCHPSRTPQNRAPKNQFFEWLNLEWQYFMILVDI